MENMNRKNDWVGLMVCLYCLLLILVSFVKTELFPRQEKTLNNARVTLQRAILSKPEFKLASTDEDRTVETCFDEHMFSIALLL